MSTRALIGRKTTSGWEAVYHHWDGYVSGLGSTLYELYNSHFKGEITSMLHILIDEHRAGWSNLVNADWTQKPGFVERIKPDDMNWDEYNDLTLHRRPQCYCHGDRHEKPSKLITMQSKDTWGAEYAYAIDEENALMEVYKWQWEGKQWMYRLTVNMNEPAPQWENFD